MCGRCLGGPGCGSVGSSSVALTDYRWQIFGGHESVLSMRRPYGGGALLTQLSYWVSSGGDLRLGACAGTVAFYIQAKHLQSLVPVGVGGVLVPHTPGHWGMMLFVSGCRRPLLCFSGIGGLLVD